MFLINMNCWDICFCFFCLFITQSIQVAITENNIKHLQLFEDNQPGSMLLALHHPDDPAQGFESKLSPLLHMQKLNAYMFCFFFNLSVVAVFLHEEWWCVEDILHTSSKTRSGLLPVNMPLFANVSIALRLDMLSSFWSFVQEGFNRLLCKSSIDLILILSKPVQPVV